MTACILPPEREITEPSNTSPEVDFASVRPAGPVSTIGRDCFGFEVRVSGVEDPDGDPMRYRFVANNMRPDRTRVREEEVTVVRGRPSDVFTNVNTQDHFGEQFQEITNSPQAVRTGVLSLFITDAEAWANPSPTNEDGDLDLSKVVEPEDGPRPHVTVIQWAFEFDSTARGCPP